MKATRKSLRRPSGAPTISHVAKLAGVSAMTVSRVINQDPVVRSDTLQKVRDAITALNYVPNSAARSLAAADLTRLAFFYANPSASYLSEFLIGILDEIGLSNIQLLIEKSEVDAEHLSALDRLINSKIDGVILPPPLCDMKSVIDRILEAGLAVVVVGVKNVEVSSVSIDDYQAALDQTRHLIGLGHDRIGFVTGNMNHFASHERLRGYQDALAEAALPQEPAMVADGLFTYASGIEAARQLIEAPHRPTAIFASNDEMAAACIAVAHQNGLDVPEDLTVCGFDDTLLATTIWPSVTTIHQPISAMSRAAVAILIREIRARRSGQIVTPVHEVLDYTMIRRESDAPPPDRVRPFDTARHNRRTGASLTE